MELNVLQQALRLIADDSATFGDVASVLQPQ
jgi:hypothetical protein